LPAIGELEAIRPAFGRRDRRQGLPTPATGRRCGGSRPQWRRSAPAPGANSILGNSAVVPSAMP
jgi:hypothetical protein